MSKLSTLKRLITCLGCSECTEDIQATTNAQALEYLCDHADAIKGKELTTIRLRVDSEGRLVRGVWADANGVSHTIDIVSD